jgi:hypothetical protein
MEALRNSLNPEALETRRTLDRRIGPQAPTTEIIYPSESGNRVQRRAAKALARRQHKKEPVPA